MVMDMGDARLLYMDDSYLKEAEATIIDIDESGSLILDQTLFYPRGGGQPSDTGTMIDTGTNTAYKVLEVTKREGRILHKVEGQGLTVGNRVRCVLDWDRRYALMKMHTAAHLIDAILYADGGILATGNELNVDKSRIDFNMPEFTKEKVQEYIDKCNKLINDDAEIKNYYLTREEAFKIPGIVKLAAAFPPDIPVLRITEIVGIDIQADGGTHVKSLSEIGKITLLSIENKGKDRKRIYFELR
jgi:Ser-tRNA(Ala) deacylase AlaX